MDPMGFHEGGNPSPFTTTKKASNDTCECQISASTTFAAPSPTGYPKTNTSLEQ